MDGVTMPGERAVAAGGGDLLGQRTYGCRAHDLTKARTLDELGAACERQGVRYIQLALGKSFSSLASGFDKLNPGLGAHVRRALAAHNVEVAVMGCYFNLIDADPAARVVGICKFKSYLQNASHFGASIVATETGSVDPDFRYTEDNFTEGAFEEAAAVIERLVHMGERCGTIVGIEPGVNHPIHDIETCERLVERIDSPYLGFVFDATALITPQTASGQLAMAARFLDRLGDRVVASHVVDYRVESVGAAGQVEPCIVRCNMGEGQLDVDGLLKLLDSVLPHVYVITEFTEGDAIGRFVRSRSQCR